MASRYFGLAIVVLLFTTACGKDNPTTPSSNGSSGSGSSGGSSGGAATPNSLSARIDGTLWNAAQINASVSSGVLTIASSDNTTGIGLVLPAATGAYTTSGAAVFTAQLSISGNAWFAGTAVGSGNVTVTSISTNSAAGTFSLTFIPVSSATVGNKTVTEGSFNVKW